MRIDRELSDSKKCSNFHIVGVPEEEEREKWEENLFKERIAENFPNLGKETDIQIQEAQKISIKWTKAGQYKDIF